MVVSTFIGRYIARAQLGTNIQVNLLASYAEWRSRCCLGRHGCVIVLPDVNS